jgi:hypothetical protein
MSNLLFFADFTKAGVGTSPDAAPTVSIYGVNRSTGAEASVVSGGACTASALAGRYFYRLGTADLQTYDYHARFNTTDTTVDAADIPSLWTRWSEAIATDADGKAAATVASGDDADAASVKATLEGLTDFTATSPGATALTLDASDPARATSQVGNRIFITGGTAGVGQVGIVTASDTSTGVQTVGAGWSAGVTPTGTVTYSLLPPDGGAGSAPTAADIRAEIDATSTQLAALRAGVVVATNNDKLGYKLAGDGLNALTGFNGWNFPRMVRALAAVVIGKRSGVPAFGQPGTITFTDQATGDYGTLAVDTAGNITSNTMTPAS